MTEQYFEYNKDLHKRLDDGTVWVYREEIDWAETNKSTGYKEDRKAEDVKSYKALPWYRKLFAENPENLSFENYFRYRGNTYYKKEWVQSFDRAFLDLDFDPSGLTASEMDGYYGMR